MSTPAEDRDEAIKAAARMIVDAAMDILYSDPHSWSTRGCTTCKTITALLGKPFGCYRYQEKKP